MVLPFLLSGTVFQVHKQITQFHAHPDVCCTLFSPTRSPYSSSTPSLCPQIRSRYPNEIIFGLNDGYYAADFDHKVEPLSLSLFCGDFAQLWNGWSQCHLLYLDVGIKHVTCSRIRRSGRITVCFRSTRVQSGTPTAFSLCSGKSLPRCRDVSNIDSPGCCGVILLWHDHTKKLKLLHILVGLLLQPAE